ncbi:MAG: ArnT family glycosyltransferase [Planctomycetota bacterium]
MGYWILGAVHHLFDPAPDDPLAVSVVAGRFAGALAFGMLVLIVGLWTTRAEGPVAGCVAAAAVVLVPRMFAHGHLAGLDTFTALLFVAAVLAVAEADARGGRLWHYAAAGFVFGLAMLTRLHGLLLVPPVIAWLFWRLRGRALLPLVVWGGTGLATLFAGWPWLWLAPIERLMSFVGTSTDRQPLHVFYAGQVWEDRLAPWHYPIVMFVVTLPLGLLLLGGIGMWAKRRAHRDAPGYLLVFGTLLFVLLVFSWPAAPVYDGVRLFLMVFPLWAVSVGVGAKTLVEWPAWRGRPARLRLAVVGLLVVLQGLGVALYHPCQLSHYSLLVGGLWGAEKLGFEVTYWGDAVVEPLLDQATRLSPGAPILFGPNLARSQVYGVWISSPSLIRKEQMERRVPLVGWDANEPEAAAKCRYAILYHRRADLDGIPPHLQAAEPLDEHRKQGVWLARLIEIPSAIVEHPDSRGRVEPWATAGMVRRGAAPSTPTPRKLECRLNSTHPATGSLAKHGPTEPF